jgi:hypothetical protein
MINTFASSRQSTQLNGIHDSDNEHLLELTSDELSGLYGGRSAVVKRFVEAIAASAAWDAMKAVWNSRGSSGDPVTTYDDPPGGYYAA